MRGHVVVGRLEGVTQCYRDLACSGNGFRVAVYLDAGEILRGDAGEGVVGVPVYQLVHGVGTLLILGNVSERPEPDRVCAEDGGNPGIG
jgi:hypothetical protein